MDLRKIFSPPYASDLWGMYIYASADKPEERYKVLRINEWSKRAEKLMDDLSTVINGGTVSNLFEPTSCENGVITLKAGPQITVEPLKTKLSNNPAEAQQLFAKWIFTKMQENDNYYKSQLLCKRISN